MDPVHDRGSMNLVHESGPWTWSKVGVHGPLVHVLSSPQLYRHQRSQRTWKTFTALSGNRFWTRHVLLSGPKLQNTNCTDTFSTALTRHKQQTSGRLLRANNTIVKLNVFFKFMPLVSVSFHKSCPSFDGMRSIDNTSRQVFLSKKIFPLIFIATIRQIFCL